MYVNDHQIREKLDKHLNFKLRQLEAFQTVARTGLITRAAKELGISQPATSRLLADFAKTVDFPLFRRESGSLVPTVEAEVMLGQIDRVFENLNYLEDLRHNLKKRAAGHLRIACLPGFATSHLPIVLSKFLQDRPQVTVTLEPDRPERILEWIIGQQYDCGITDGFGGHPAVESTDIHIPAVCIMPANHPLADKDVVTPADLRTEQLIHPRRDSPFFHKLEKAFVACDEQINSWIEVRQFTTACAIVSQGQGVAVVSFLDAEQYKDQGLVARPFEPHIVHRVSLLRPTAGGNAPLVFDFLKFFSDSLLPYLEPNSLAASNDVGVGS